MIGSPSFAIEDLDNIEVHTWSLTGGNGTSYISINTNNGTIMLKVYSHVFLDLEWQEIKKNVC